MKMNLKKLAKVPRLNNPILIEGLPGMGNVGKITVDFMIEHLRAKKFLEIHSPSFPNSVFINEDNLIELPKIELFYKETKNHSLVLLSGDVQPLEETSCYEFCETILDTFQSLKGKEIVTLGGIGLSDIPKNPKVYCTGNNKSLIEKYKKLYKINSNLYGLVGPIVGVSGLLLGLSKERNIPSISLLAETYAHPGYLGIKGAREILKILNKNFNLNLRLNELDREIDEIEKESKIQQGLQQLPIKRSKSKRDITYIG
jgi:uncharacterized protein